MMKVNYDFHSNFAVETSTKLHWRYLGITLFNMNWIIRETLLLTYSHELFDPILFKAGLIKPQNDASKWLLEQINLMRRKYKLIRSKLISTWLKYVVAQLRVQLRLVEFIKFAHTVGDLTRNAILIVCRMTKFYWKILLKNKAGQKFGENFAKNLWPLVSKECFYWLEICILYITATLRK